MKNKLTRKTYHKKKKNKEFEKKKKQKNQRYFIVILPQLGDNFFRDPKRRLIKENQEK